MARPENSQGDNAESETNNAELISKLGKLAGYGVTVHFYGRWLGRAKPTEINNDLLIMLGEGMVSVWGTASAVNIGMKRWFARREEKYQVDLGRLEKDLYYDEIEGHPDNRAWRGENDDESEAE